MAMPLTLGPIGLGGLCARRGETQAVRAANEAAVPFCLSTISACPIDEVAHVATQPFWFQLYMIRDRGFMCELLAKAKAARCSALVFTVDMPVPGARYRDLRSGLAGAPGFAGQLRRFGQALRRPYWAWDVGVCGRPHHLGNVAPVLGDRTGLEDFFGWMRSNFDATVTWQDLEWVRANWSDPLIVKGILDAEDAREVVARGADGGIRNGLDVVRMLALGARGVLLGRSWIYALAGGGYAGVAHMLKLFEAEMRVAMALTGVTRVADISPDCLVDGQQQ